MNIIPELKDWHGEFRDIRRDIHAHPELSYEEKRTSALIQSLLQQWGVETTSGLASTGVVGTIRGKRGNSTRAIGLRADIDALPMQEANQFGHASTYAGRMHACGHDGHTTMLLAATRYLAQTRDFDGIVHVIFQPAEEGGAGARRMMEDGLFERFPVEAVFGMHNWPGLPAGEFGVCAGPIMASCAEFQIHIEGKGTHAAMPHLGVDPIMPAVQIAQALQTIISRNRNPLDTAVLSITQIHTGSADNIIPTHAVVSGTVRTYADSMTDMVEHRMQTITEQIAAAFNCVGRLKFHRTYPATINDPGEAAFCAQALKSIAGAAKVNDAVRPSMASEDFAYMLRARPGCYFWLGAGDGSHRSGGHGEGPCLLHNDSYDFNDDLIPVGASAWVALAQQRLTPAAQA